MFVEKEFIFLLFLAFGHLTASYKVFYFIQPTAKNQENTRPALTNNGKNQQKSELSSAVLNEANYESDFPDSGYLPDDESYDYNSYYRLKNQKSDEPKCRDLRCIFLSPKNLATITKNIKNLNPDDSKLLDTYSEEGSKIIRRIHDILNEKKHVKDDFVKTDGKEQNLQSDKNDLSIDGNKDIKKYRYLSTKDYIRKHTFPKHARSCGLEMCSDESDSDEDYDEDDEITTTQNPCEDKKKCRPKTTTATTKKPCTKIKCPKTTTASTTENPCTKNECSITTTKKPRKKIDMYDETITTNELTDSVLDDWGLTYSWEKDGNGKHRPKYRKNYNEQETKWDGGVEPGYNSEESEEVFTRPPGGKHRVLGKKEKLFRPRISSDYIDISELMRAISKNKEDRMKKTQKNNIASKQSFDYFLLEHRLHNELSKANTDNINVRKKPKDFIIRHSVGRKQLEEPNVNEDAKQKKELKKENVKDATETEDEDSELKSAEEKSEPKKILRNRSSDESDSSSDESEETQETKEPDDDEEQKRDVEKIKPPKESSEEEVEQEERPERHKKKEKRFQIVNPKKNKSTKKLRNVYVKTDSSEEEEKEISSDDSQEDLVQASPEFTTKKPKKSFPRIPNKPEHYLQNRGRVYKEGRDFRKHPKNLNFLSRKSDRLPIFMPKRLHWDPSEFHKLGYFWFNGPQGRFGGNWKTYH